MKTPRELLFERHASANAKLDAVRTRVLANALPAAAAETAGARPGAIPLRAWQELVWSCRRIWLGLGVAWVIILALNLITHDRSARAPVAAVETSPQIRALLREQKRMLAELIDSSPAEPAAVPFVPRPRSEGRLRFLVG